MDKITVKYNTQFLEVIIDKDKPWTLCVIDDNWFIVEAFFEERDDCFNRNAYDQFRSNVSGEGGAQKRALVSLAYYAPQLEELGRLIVGDFERQSDEVSCIEYVGDDDSFTENAFLVDVIDEISEDKKRGKKVVKKLKKEDIPEGRIAYLSIGGYVSGRELIKYRVNEEVKKDENGYLINWWKDVRDVIHNGYFKRKTQHNEDWHEPSSIPITASTSDDSFEEFLNELASRDAYCVWRWVGRVIDGEADELEKRYAYLCGKAFVQCSDMQDIPFTALRGLSHGLASRFNATVDEVLDFPDDIDRPLSQGKYHTGNGSSLNDIAPVLVKFIEKLHKEGEIKIHKVIIERGDRSCRIHFRFSGPLSLSIFKKGVTKKKGRQVYNAWDDVTDCFGYLNEPAFNRTDNGDVKSVELKLTYSEPTL